MKLSKAIEILEKHNKWRRGNDDYEMANPKELGIAIETVIKYCKSVVAKNAQTT